MGKEKSDKLALKDSRNFDFSPKTNPERERWALNGNDEF